MNEKLSKLYNAVSLRFLSVSSPLIPSRIFQLFLPVDDSSFIGSLKFTLVSWFLMVAGTQV